MKVKSSACLILSLSLFTYAYGLTGAPSAGPKPAVSVLSADGEGFVLHMEFPQPDFKQIIADGETFHQVGVNGCGLTSQVGKPEIPAYTKLIRLPKTGGLSVSVSPGDAVIYSDINIFPAQPLTRENDEEPAFMKDEKTYQSEGYYPEKIIETGEIAVWGNLRVAPVNVFPFRYNPAKRELKYYRSITVEVIYTEHGDNEMHSPRNFVSEAFAPLYESLSIGPEGFELDLPVERGAYLIITPPTYYNQLQELANWKTRMGYYTYIATTSETGASANQIKNYISNAYNTWEVPPEYVVLIGDTYNGMPTFFVQGYNYQCCTDLDYTLLEGDDYFPELFIGRLSVGDITDLTRIWNKMENYEMNPYLGQTDWYDRALVIADYIGCESVRYTKDFTEDQLEYGGYTNIVNAYYPGSSTSLISQTINQGVSLVNYRGYGGHTFWTMNMWNHWDVGDINALINGYQTPVVTSMVCGGGNFNYSSTCFGEAFIRAGTASTPKGCVAFCGPSELYTHTKWNNNLDCELYWGIFRQDIQHFGPALLYSKMGLWLDYPHNRVGIGSGSNSVGFYFHVYNILGDPGLRMWTREPQPITADYGDSISLGMNQFDIALSDTGGQAIADAYVCIWKDDEIYEGGFSDEFGQITLPLNECTAGVMKLTVTGKNLIPLLQDIQIVADDICLGIDAMEIIDDNSGGTSGNGDGMLSPAETADLLLTVKNFGGSVTGTGITGTLTAASPMVTIIQGTGDFGNLEPGESAEASFTLSLAPDLTAADELGLTLELDCPQGNWSQVVWAEVSDAQFVPIDYEYSPAMLEPGGQADLILTLQNNGLCDATGVAANLISLDPLIEVLAGNAAFGDILAGATGDNSLQPLSLGASVIVIPGRIAHLQLNFNTGEGYTPTSDLMLTVGTVNQSDPMGPDEYGYYCFDSGDIGYVKAPVFNWINFTGTQLYLPDYGDEEDCRVSVNLPFTFTYYGEDYILISVCSNGFISMGYSDVVQFRNKAIPSAMGPPAMIAGFWDDLQMTGGGAVYQFYDSPNHRFIIEYRNVKNDYQNANERFQIILCDPAYYLTPTGDGEIVIQYDDVNDWDSADNYSTVGIEDWDHTTGLEYVFSNIYPASSHTLSDGLAIRFTTDSGTPATPELELTFEPVNPPIVIPAGGGSFNFSVGAINIGATTASFDFWTEVDLPGGTTISPIMLRSSLTLEPGASMMRTMMQNVPPRAPSGQYTFRGVLGVHPGTIYASDEFNFDKELDGSESNK